MYTVCYTLVLLYCLKSSVRYCTKSVKLWSYCTFFIFSIRNCTQSVTPWWYCIFFKSSVSYCIQSATLWWYCNVSSPVSGTVQSLLHVGLTVLSLYPASGTVHSLLHFGGTVMSQVQCPVLFTAYFCCRSLCTYVPGVRIWEHLKQHPTWTKAGNKT